MEKIIIDNNHEDLPKVILDKEANIFEISGKSFPENAIEFYSPIIKWIKEYVENPNQETIFTIDLEYFSSSSSKKIFEILLELELLTETGKNITVKWFFEESNDVVFKRSKDIQEVVNVPIEFIEKTK